MVKHDENPTLLRPHIATDLADELNRNDDDDWHYEAEHAPEGRGLSRVVVFDHTGYRLGSL